MLSHNSHWSLATPLQTSPCPVSPNAVQVMTCQLRSRFCWEKLKNNATYFQYKWKSSSNFGMGKNLNEYWYITEPFLLFCFNCVHEFQTSGDNKTNTVHVWETLSQNGSVALIQSTVTQQLHVLIIIIFWRTSRISKTEWSSLSHFGGYHLCFWH